MPTGLYSSIYFKYEMCGRYSGVSCGRDSYNGAMKWKGIIPKALLGRMGRQRVLCAGKEQRGNGTSSIQEKNANGYCEGFGGCAVNMRQ